MRLAYRPNLRQIEPTFRHCRIIIRINDKQVKKLTGEVAKLTDEVCHRNRISSNHTVHLRRDRLGGSAAYFAAHLATRNRNAPSGATRSCRRRPRYRSAKRDRRDGARGRVLQNGMIELDRSALLRVTADTIPAMVGYIDASRRVGFLNEEFGRWFDLRVDDVSQNRVDELFRLDRRVTTIGTAGEEGAASAIRFQLAVSLASGWFQLLAVRDA